MVDGTPIKNVAYVVKTAIERLGGPVTDIASAEAWAIQWMSEDARGVTALPCFKVCHIDVSPSKQVAMPSDMMRYTKIAIDYGGKLWTLSLDPDITLPAEFSCTTDTSTDTTQGVYFMPHWWGGVYYGALFGMGGGFNQAYYRLDGNTLKLLGDTNGRKVVVEYLSNGNDVNAATLMPHYWIAPLRNYLMWQLTRLRPDRYKFDPRQFKDDYDLSMENAAFATGPTIYEMLDAYDRAPGLKI